MNNKIDTTQSEIKRLSTDLHDALTEIPLDITYFKKLELYSKILIEDYNWHRVEIYSTHAQLDALPAGSRVTTSDDALAVKHDTGWVIVTPDGYTFTHNSSKDLTLPVFSILVNRHRSQDAVSLDDGTQNDQQISETDNKR